MTNTARLATAGSLFQRWAAGNAEVVAFLTTPDFDPEGSRFLARMVSKVNLGRALTPTEVAAVERNIARHHDRAARFTTPQAPTGGPLAPTGRLTVEGIVVEVAIRPGFRASSPDLKMTVQADAGYPVFATVPQALVQDPDAEDLGLTGARVRFTAALSPSPDNPHVAIGKGPRGVALLTLPPSGDPPLTRVA